MSITGLTPWMDQEIGQLLDFAQKQGIAATVVSTRRTCAEQDALYAEGRDTGGDVVTKAKGCQSWHVWGRAADLHIDGPFEGYATLGAEWKRMGGVWGGDWGWDFGHFEWHPDVTLRELCPTGNECPSAAPWPEDRPFFARRGVRMFLGAALGGGGLALAYVLVRR